jgi:hypothetical protein
MIDDVLRAQFNFTARPENYVVTDSGGCCRQVSAANHYVCTFGAYHQF